MKAGTAALRSCGDQNARVSTVLGVEYTGLHLEFTDRIHAELRVLSVVRAYVGVNAAVEIDIVHTAAQTVNIERIGVVEGQPEVGRIVGNDARQGAEQGLPVAPVQAGFGYLLAGDDERFIRGRGLDLGG